MYYLHAIKFMPSNVLSFIDQSKYNLENIILNTVLEGFPVLSEGEDPKFSTHLLEKRRKWQKGRIATDER